MAWLAPVASSLIGTGTGVAGRNSNKKGNKRAQSAIDKSYEDAKRGYQPYAGSGAAAQQMLNKLLGLEGYRTTQETAYSDYLKTAPEGVDLSRYNKKGFEGFLDSQERISTIGDTIGGVKKYFNDKNKKKQKRAAQATATNQASWQAKADELKAASEASLANYDQEAVVKGIVESTPGYHFRYGLGETAVNNSLSGRNMTQSGLAGKEMLRYGQDYASKEYQNALSNYGAAAGRGFDANSALANLASGQGTNLSNLAIRGGQNDADYYSTLNNAAQSGIANYYAQRNRSSYQNDWNDGGVSGDGTNRVPPRD